MQVDTGLLPIGRVPWGTHFCHFYRSQSDLSETLVPYFKTGLESAEACLWVTAEPFSKAHAIAALRTYFADLDERIAAGQLTVLDHAEWYEQYGGASSDELVAMWLRAKDNAQKRGYHGLRLSGNTAFVTSEAWDDFTHYETAVREAFHKHEILGLCSYQADQWHADAILDVVKNHDFALARRGGNWDVIESASAARSKAALVALNAELEHRVANRTLELADALTHQRMLTAELSHRVKNTLASVQAIVDQTLRQHVSPTEGRKVIAGRLAALARAHDQLSAVDWTGVTLRDVLSALQKTFGSRIEVNVPDRILKSRAALNLTLVFHELMTNAVKYGSLGASAGRVTVEHRPRSDAPGSVEIVWRERGGPAVTAPEHEGFGTRLIQELVTHDLMGECELVFEAEGLTCRLHVPSSELSNHLGACTHGCSH